MESESTVELTPKEKSIASRIKLMLGGHILKLEITDSDIKELIDIALNTVAPYVVDYKYLTVPYRPSIDLSEEKIEEVLRVMPCVSVGGYSDDEEFTFDFTGINYAANTNLSKASAIEMMRRKITPDTDIPFDFDAESKILMPKMGIISGNLTLECIPEVVDLEMIRDKSTQKWVYLYTLALAKEVVGRIRSKAKSTNIPIELDGDTLLSEASTEKASLESSLLADQTGPIAMIR